MAGWESWQSPSTWHSAGEGAKVTSSCLSEQAVIKRAPGPPGYQEEMEEVGQAQRLLLPEHFKVLKAGLKSGFDPNLGVQGSHREASFGKK